ncbi:MAG: four helix bundle protein [Bacteroidales bacterium]|jgi:four helix bundle protein|nr:four helix bundle protein [Bacteroidales bacterium]MBR4176156.1 four helix bundle protein [Bacteroidales bacterium]MBR4714591.1 four helix bundle protein [Bacteroidales bacterium]MCR4930837.1 four helix bundle protein [Bacteroidales bacterium]
MAYFEELVSWQKAKELTLKVYSLMQNVKDYGFRDQIQRASVSIMNNIAEGSDYNSNQMFVKFLKIAKGSCAEVRSMTYLCKELNYCTEEQFNELLNESRILSSTINNHIKYLLSTI